ncbi:Uncharacterised protein [Legionella lansingensis]|uniref:Uncharacterized protein n=1 Tax=Legionella lansingensis TaxID=45067 RepID=A0A0W0VF24_9GAMM|nr:hypothetical protein [Legionella lansingensis]KTD18734.1 hypothetical protein Llan_2337 [Legionella lansingensis]SNV58301.1 Uncharacterised protein [Legionella lansingensis]
MKTSTFKMILIYSLVLFALPTLGLAEAISQSESDAARILMLEKALAPKTPDAVASMFAEANKDRNGAVQFMLFSDQLKNKYKDNWPYWVSGASSPWITSYKIKKTAQKKNSWQFQITYEWATSAGPFQPALLQTIVVEPVPKNIHASQQWWITQFSEG